MFMFASLSLWKVYFYVNTLSTQKKKKKEKVSSSCLAWLEYKSLK